MSTFDAFSKAEELITRYPVEKDGKKIYVYELKLSNASEVLAQGLKVISNDSSRLKDFVVIFNAKHLKTEKETIKTTETILDQYKDLLFSPKLRKFAIIVKSFISHRALIDEFDRLFLKYKVDRKKYNYFSLKNADQVIDWLTG